MDTSTTSPWLEFFVRYEMHFAGFYTSFCLSFLNRDVTFAWTRNTTERSWTIKPLTYNIDEKMSFKPFDSAYFLS